MIALRSFQNGRGPLNEKQKSAVAVVRTFRVLACAVVFSGSAAILHAQAPAASAFEPKTYRVEVRDRAQSVPIPSLAVRPEARAPDAVVPRTAAVPSGRTHRIAGAAVGFVAGAGITYVILHSGGSTSPCDRSANQDAMRPIECAGLVALGGAVGAGVGFLIGGLFGSETAATPLQRVRVGIAPTAAEPWGLAISAGWPIR